MVNWNKVRGPWPLYYSEKVRKLENNYFHQLGLTWPLLGGKIYCCWFTKLAGHTVSFMSNKKKNFTSYASHASEVNWHKTKSLQQDVLQASSCPRDQYNVHKSVLIPFRTSFSHRFLFSHTCRIQKIWRALSPLQINCVLIVGDRMSTCCRGY